MATCVSVACYMYPVTGTHILTIHSLTMLEKTESGKSNADVERYAHYAHDGSRHAELKATGDVVTVEEERDLKRGLAQRHVSMIALAGTFREAASIVHSDSHQARLGPASFYRSEAVSRRAAHSARSWDTSSSASLCVRSSLRSVK